MSADHPNFEVALTGGHPNSLGNTVEVVDNVLASENRIKELFSCYDSSDEIVRLRTSNAFKRIFREKPFLFKPLIDHFFEKIPPLNQPSAQWTLAQICLECEEQLSASQKEKATEIIKGFLDISNDWIVLNASMETLGNWAKTNHALKTWLLPHLEKNAKDERKTVSKIALKFQKILK